MHFAPRPALLLLTATLSGCCNSTAVLSSQSSTSASGIAATSSGSIATGTTTGAAATAGTTGGAVSQTSGTAGGSSNGSGTSGSSSSSGGPSNTTGSIPGMVWTYGNSNARTGVYTDPAFTEAQLAAIAGDGGLLPDPSFAATVAGRVYATPLFMTNGIQGNDALFVADEEDNLYAFDAHTGATLWHTSLGTPARLSELGRGNIDPIGVTSAPVLDLSLGRIYLDAMVDRGDGGPSGDGGSPVHDVLGIDVVTGNVLWTLEMDSILPRFSAVYQNSRAALMLLGSTLYIPYGGHFGECNPFNGRVAAIPLGNGSAPTPSSVYEFTTLSPGGGIWGQGSVASDGSSVFTVTGSTFGATTWDAGLGQAVLRLPPDNLAFSSLPEDFFSPNQWLTLAGEDLSLSGSGLALLEDPGVASGHLVFVIGKNGTGYLLDRENLGGINLPDQPVAFLAEVSTAIVAGSEIAYTTPNGSYVGFLGTCWSGGEVGVLQVGLDAGIASLSEAFCVGNGHGSPMVTNSDGLHDTLVWSLAAQSDSQVRAYDGDTGDLVVSSTGIGGPGNDASVTHWVQPIVANGSMYIAGNNQIYAIRVK